MSYVEAGDSKESTQHTLGDTTLSSFRDGPERVMNILRVSAFCGSKGELLAKIRTTKSFIAVQSLNAEILIQAKEDDKLNAILKNNTYNIADGYWVAKALHLKYGISVEKISGADFIFDLLDIAASLSWRVFLLGASEDTSRKAIQRIRTMYGNLSVEAYAPPAYVTSTIPEDENVKILQKIERYMPHVLVVCFGAPKEQYWIHKNMQSMEQISVKVSLSAGGTLDFISGKVKRAPKWVQNTGLEWLYRLCREPKLRFNRIAKRLPKYCILALMDILEYRVFGAKGISG